MKKINLKILAHSLALIFIANFLLTSCLDDDNYDPAIDPLRQGFKVSAAVGYCASLANTLFRGEDLPDNVIFTSNTNNDFSGSGIMYVTINEEYPLPFNSNVGQIVILCLWNVNYDQTEYSGVITTIFTDINILESKYEFKGIHTIPVMERDNGDILTLFAAQDIIIGEGSDTILNLSMSNPQFITEVDRLDATQPTDAFAAVKQNVWFVNIDQNSTGTDIYDDEFTINGGGQMAEASDDGGGIQYHAMIGAEFVPDICSLNPIDGVGFIQNIRATTLLDFGHIFLSFHDECDGKAYVDVANGSFKKSKHLNVNLRFQ